MAKATNTTGAAKNTSTTSVGAALKAAGATTAQQQLPATKSPAPSAPSANATTSNAPAKPAKLTAEQRKALSPEQRKAYKAARQAYMQWKRGQRPSPTARLVKDCARIAKVLAKRAAMFDSSKVGEHEVNEALSNAAQWLTTAGTAVTALGPNWKPSTAAGKAEAAKSLTEGGYVTLTEKGAKEAEGFIASGTLRIKKVIGNKALVCDSEGGAIVLALKHCVPCDPPATQA